MVPTTVKNSTKQSNERDQFLHVVKTKLSDCWASFSVPSEVPDPSQRSGALFYPRIILVVELVSLFFGWKKKTHSARGYLATLGVLER